MITKTHRHKLAKGHADLARIKKMLAKYRKKKPKVTTFSSAGKWRSYEESTRV